MRRDATTAALLATRKETAIRFHESQRAFARAQKARDAAERALKRRTDDLHIAYNNLKRDQNAHNEACAACNEAMRCQ